MENKLSTVLTRIDLKDLLNHYTDKALWGKKKLEALEIIKKDPQRALLISDYKDYNEYINDKDPYWIEKELMKKDEFDLLKEVMK